MVPVTSLLGRREDAHKQARTGKRPGGKQAVLAAAAAAPDTNAAAMLLDDFAPPTREVVRPANQLVLSEAALGEEVAKMLTANNPAAPQNLTRFNMKERAYKFEPMVEQHVVHYACDGWLLHRSSEEARKQAEQEKAEADAAARFQAEMDRALKEKAAGLDVELPDNSRTLRNQFNFTERAAQTFSYPLRDRATFTEPAPTASTSGSCSMWEIYDAYTRDLGRQRQEDASKQRPGAAKRATSSVHAAAASTAVAAAASSAAAAAAPTGLQDAAAAGSGVAEGSAATPRAGGGGDGSGQAAGSGSQQLQQQQQAWAADATLQDRLRILDRMVNQNTFAEVALDFKYWEDASDAFRPGEGSLLPLWQFACERGRKHVTALAWSSGYADQFAAGFGSFHFQRQGAGAISLFSLKNPSHAELTITTDSGVMALAFHPEFANLLAVGCYDGSVAVYDMRQRSGRPLYAASPKAARHTDTVWQVCWQVDELQHSLAFTSTSSDGDVLLWTLTKCELLPERLMRLQPPPAHAAAAAAAAGGTPAAGQPAQGASGGSISGAGSSAPGAADLLPAQLVEGGLCMDFCKVPGHEAEYLVGTEAGSVLRCSKAYGSGVLGRYAGHGLPVYAVKWSGCHGRVFVSCSADWSVAVWDVGQQAAPLLTFDLGAPVGDVAWAPYSSTVLAAVTDEGRVHVFDLAQNRQQALCVQRCAKKKARLLRVAFSAHHPILLVGDSKGSVWALKLSPNLRKTAFSGSTGSLAAASAGGRLAVVEAGSGAPAATLPAAGAAGDKPPPQQQGAAGASSSSSSSRALELERAKLERVLEVARRSQAPMLTSRASAGGR